MKRSRRRAGLTLIEVLVAMTLTVSVFAIVLPFLETQTRAMGSSARRQDAEQNARYAIATIARDLRRASADSAQPLLVLAGTRAIVFTADLLAADTTGVDAVDVDAGGPLASTVAWDPSAARALPLTTRLFPTQAYLDRSGAASRRETISYFLHPDTVSGRTDLFVLWRRVNAGDSIVVVRELVLPPDTAFFRYARPGAAGPSGVVTQRPLEIAAARLPLYWDSLAIDSIRSVTMRATGRYVDRRTNAEVQRTIWSTTALPNAASRTGDVCGAAPGPPTGPSVAAYTSNLLWSYKVGWSPSADDRANSGARDVRGYVVEWLPAGTAVWQSLATISARQQPTYEWHHLLPVGAPAGATAYRIRAIDCGARVSTAVTASVTVTY